MAITKRSSSTLASSTHANSTISAPTGAATGDYIVVALLIGNSSSVTPTAPSGWTLIGSTSYSAPDPWTVNLFLYGKFFDGAGSWTWTHTSATTQAFTSAYIGVDSSTPIDVTAAVAFQNQVATDGPATAVAPSLTIVTVDAEGVIARGSWDGNAITPPVGWTEEYDAPVLWVGDRAWSSTGATGTVLVPHGNGGPNPPRLPWGIIHAALRPASGSAITGTIIANTPTVTVDVPTVAWSGTATAPTFTGGIAGDIPPVTIAVPGVAWSGTATPPLFTGAVMADLPAVTVSVPDVAWSGAVTDPGAFTGTLDAQLPTLTVDVPTVGWSGTVTAPTFSGAFAADTPTVSITVPEAAWTGTATPPSFTGTLAADTPTVTVDVPQLTYTGNVTPPSGAVLVTTLPEVTIAVPEVAWSGAATIPVYAGLLAADLPPVSVDSPAVDWAGATTTPAVTGTLTATVPPVTIQAPTISWITTYRDITVTGALGPSRWAGTIRTRWEGHL